MLSSVLRSKRAVQVNIEIMRAFVRLRKIIASNKDLAKRLDELEKKYDAQFKVVFDAIRQLMTPANVFTRPPLEDYFLPNAEKVGKAIRALYDY